MLRTLRRLALRLALGLPLVAMPHGCGDPAAAPAAAEVQGHALAEEGAREVLETLRRASALDGEVHRDLGRATLGARRSLRVLDLQGDDGSIDAHLTDTQLAVFPVRVDGVVRAAIQLTLVDGSWRLAAITDGPDVSALDAAFAESGRLVEVPALGATLIQPDAGAPVLRALGEGPAGIWHAGDAVTLASLIQAAGSGSTDPTTAPLAMDRLSDR